MIPRAGIAFHIIVIVFLLHTCISEVRPRTSKFFSLSYYNPRTGKYGAGFDDLYFIAFCIVLLTGLRAGVMEYVLAPIARVGGLLKSKEVTRFSEQAWLTTWCFVVVSKSWLLFICSWCSPISFSFILCTPIYSIHFSKRKYHSRNHLE